MEPSPDVLVVGGGIIGLTTALFLAESGRRVEVLDKGEFGREAETQTGWVSERPAWVCRDGRRRLRARLVRVRLKQPTQDGDLVVFKTTFSAVLSSDLVDRLRARGIDTVVTGGLTTPICVQTTVDGLSMTGLKVIVLADACASQAIGTLSAEAAHEAAIARMGYLFAAVQDTDAFVAQVRALQPAAG